MSTETPSPNTQNPEQLKIKAENDLSMAITRIENASRKYTYDDLVKAITIAKENKVEIPPVYSEDKLPDIHKKCLLGEIAEQLKYTKEATEQRMYCYMGLKIAIEDAEKNGIIVNDPTKETLHALFSEAIAEEIEFKKKLFMSDPIEINYDFYDASLKEAVQAGVDLKKYNIEDTSTLASHLQKEEDPSQAIARLALSE